MVAVLIILGIVAFFVTLHVAMSWAGRCKSCRSWKNWLEVKTTTDDHQPSVYFENTIATCSNCHNKVFVHTVTKNKVISQHERYKQSH